MSSEGKVIITCAVTGAIHTPSMSPYLPVTAAEIAEAAIGAAEAGAAVVHLHARDESDGRPDQSIEAFRPFRVVSARAVPEKTRIREEERVSHGCRGRAADDSVRMPFPRNVPRAECETRSSQ